MKKALMTLAMLAFATGAAYAQANAALDTALIANEHKLNDAVAKGDKAAFLALVSADAWSANAHGVMKVTDFAAMLDQMKVTTWAMSDEKVSWVDTNTAIVVYKWTGSGTFQAQAFNGPTYASTVWTKKAGKWVAVYHQETEAAK